MSVHATLYGQIERHDICDVFSMNRCNICSLHFTLVFTYFLAHILKKVIKGILRFNFINFYY